MKCSHRCCAMSEVALTSCFSRDNRCHHLVRVLLAVAAFLFVFVAVTDVVNVLWHGIPTTCVCEVLLAVTILILRFVKFCFAIDGANDKALQLNRSLQNSKLLTAYDHHSRRLLVWNTEMPPPASSDE